MTTAYLGTPPSPFRQSQILIGVYGLLALAMLAAYASLLGFHIYLMWLGLGTYDWLIRKFAPAPTAASPRGNAGANNATNSATNVLSASSSSGRLPERPVSVTGQAV